MPGVDNKNVLSMQLIAQDKEEVPDNKRITNCLFSLPGKQSPQVLRTALHFPSGCTLHVRALLSRKDRPNSCNKGQTAFIKTDYQLTCIKEVLQNCNKF